MSWNWDDKEEVKDYGVNGTVTISTAEYRDMIARVYELKAAGAQEHEDWRKELHGKLELEHKNEVLESKLKVFGAWIESDESIKSKFELWKANLQEQANE